MYLTAAQVNEEGSVEVLMIDQHCMLPGTAGMLQGKITLLSPPKKVAALLVQQQFLEK